REAAYGTYIWNDAFNKWTSVSMTKREAALILAVREGAVAEKVREAHRSVMVANHLDAGGSHYLASKINEAKRCMCNG
ncbi:mitochondrial import inner membrane translocase subunit TIM14-1, partial [Tanacetum coccineum]